MKAFLTAILIMGAMAIPQKPAHNRLSPENFGTYMGGALGLWASPDIYEKEAIFAKNLNIGITRFNSDCWDLLEPSRGEYSWEKLDKVIDVLRRNNIDVLFTVPISAKWNASGGPVRVNNFDIGMTHFPAKNLDDIENFCFTLANRYKGRINYFEAWNEPDLFIFWKGRPDAVEYTSVLKRIYRGLKRGNPDCKVLIGGIAYPLDDSYMKALIKAGAFDYFDIMNIHVYTKSVWDARRIMTNTKNIIKWSGRDKPIWVTEVSTTPDFFKSGNRGKEEKDKAELLPKFYDLFFSQGVERVFWHTLRNCGKEAGMSKDFDFGLMTSDFRKLPVYDALREFTEHAMIKAE